MKDKKLRQTKQNKHKKKVNNSKNSKSINILDSPKRTSQNLIKQFFKEDTLSTLYTSESTQNLLENFIKAILIEIEKKDIQNLETNLKNILELSQSQNNIHKAIKDYNNKIQNKSKKQVKQNIGLQDSFNSKNHQQENLIQFSNNEGFFEQINQKDVIIVQKKRCISQGKYSDNFLDILDQNNQGFDKNNKFSNSNDQGLKLPKSLFIQTQNNKNFLNIQKIKSHQQFRNRKLLRKEKQGTPILPCKQSKCQLQPFKKTLGYSKQKLINF